jgi:hypothetical protein
MKLSEIFEEIQLKENEVAEFPLDFLAPGVKKDYWAFSHIDKCEGDFINIPLTLTEKDHKEKLAGQLLLVAATDRNILVYDNSFRWEIDKEYIRGQNYVTLLNKLPILMKTVMRKNGKGEMTDLFIDENVNIDKIFYEDTSLKINKVDHDLYNYLLGYYFNDLKRDVPDSRYNLCIGVDLNLNDSFVQPIRENKYGLAVLDNRKVLLGCY